MAKMEVMCSSPSQGNYTFHQSNASVLILIDDLTLKKAAGNSWHFSTKAMVTVVTMVTFDYP